MTITPSENGPYLVSGPVTLVGPDGHEIAYADQMKLCRCGHSSNKPFCDGTEASIDFDGTMFTSEAMRHTLAHGAER